MQEEINIYALAWPATGSHERWCGSQRVSVCRVPESVLTLVRSSLSPAAMQSWDILLRFAFLSHPVPLRGQSSEFNSHHNSLLPTYIAPIPNSPAIMWETRLWTWVLSKCNLFWKGTLTSATALFHWFPFGFQGLHRGASVETGIELSVSKSWHVKFSA